MQNLTIFRMCKLQMVSIFYAFQINFSAFSFFVAKFICGRYLIRDNGHAFKVVLKYVFQCFESILKVRARRTSLV